MGFFWGYDYDLGENVVTTKGVVGKIVARHKIEEVAVWSGEGKRTEYLIGESTLDLDRHVFINKGRWVNEDDIIFTVSDKVVPFLQKVWGCE